MTTTLFDTINHCSTSDILPTSHSLNDDEIAYLKSLLGAISADEDAADAAAAEAAAADAAAADDDEVSNGSPVGDEASDDAAAADDDEVSNGSPVGDEASDDAAADAAPEDDEVSNGSPVGEAPVGDEASLVHPSDELCEELGLRMPPPCQVIAYNAEAQQRLDELEGLQDIKKNLHSLLMLTRYNARLARIHPGSQHTLSLHSLFLGNPGTGKTTVGSLMASLLHDAGVLSKGHCVVANRSSFISSLWGEDEMKLRYLLRIAKGGVLFIDEAYLLCTSNPNDPGRTVVQLLLEELADEQNRDIAIVLGGYEEPMKQLLRLNPGLESRFPERNRFVFSDFTTDELLHITKARIARHAYTFTPRAWSEYRRIVEEAYSKRDKSNWGNARFIANILETVYATHAVRCEENHLDDSRVFSITAADLSDLRELRELRTPAAPRRPQAIGFC